MMDDSHWQEVDALFEEVLERPPSERGAFLDEAEADLEVRRRVRALLEAEAASAPFLDRRPLVARALVEALRDEAAVGEGAPRRSEDDGPDREGERIGPFRIAERIGRGGMATVYRAERVDGSFEQTVAIKVIRRGLDTEDVIRRFKAEREILSSLQHPNIARLLDGGATEDGLPYLVMERVRGSTVTAYCDRRTLPVDDRLWLFLEICQAVQYAHRNLVVHRDLKPSNILVTDEGRVMLLDFGIAKLLDPTGSPAGTTLTRPGHLVLTPEYASPEQLQAGAITTATDVYQLGVLLYRLLTGRHPYDRGPGASSSLEDVVSDTPPLRPSETLDRPPGAHGAADPVEERARRLGTGVDGLRRRLRGDLDTIILKALRKEPDRRYASVEALADDVRRHLSGRPISARPDTWGYRTRKFLARNRWVLPVAAVLAVVAGGYVLTLVRHSAELERERDLARLEADRAEEVQDFLVGLFRSADPFASPDPDRGTRLSVVEALDLGTERARSELEDRPELRADLLGAISEVFANLDDIERASALRNEALAIEREVHGPRSPEVAASLAALAKTVSYTNEADSARALFRESLALTEEIHGPEHPLVGSILTDRAWLEYRTVSPGEAEPDLARAAELLADAGPGWAVDRIDALSTLSDARREIGDIDGAAAAALEALEVATEHFDTDHVQTLHPRDSYAQALLELGRYDEAVEILRETAELQQRILGEDHLNTIATLNNLARALDRQGNLVESEEIYRRMLAIAVEKWGHDYVATADLKQNLAANLADQERYDDASALLEEAYDTYREVLEPGHYLVAYPLLTRSGLELEQGRYAEARASAREAAGILRNGLPEGHIATAAAECRVGRALAGLGEGAEAAEWLEPAVSTLLEATQATGDLEEQCAGALADLWEAQGESVRARELRARLEARVEG